jgi:hypothetical protein
MNGSLTEVLDKMELVFIPIDGEQFCCNIDDAPNGASGSWLQRLDS